MMRLYYYVKYFGRGHRNYRTFYLFQNKEKDITEVFLKNSPFEVELYTTKIYKIKQ